MGLLFYLLFLKQTRISLKFMTYKNVVRKYFYSIYPAKLIFFPDFNKFSEENKNIVDVYDHYRFIFS